MELSEESEAVVVEVERVDILNRNWFEEEDSWEEKKLKYKDSNERNKANRINISFVYDGGNDAGNAVMAHKRVDAYVD